MLWEDSPGEIEALSDPSAKTVVVIPKTEIGATGIASELKGLEIPPQAPVSTGPPPITLLGVPFDSVTQREAIERIEAMIRSRQPHYLATANVDFLVQAQHDEELRRILLEAHMVLCDGTPLLWASRWLGQPLPERVAGADLVPELICRAAAKGYRVFFLGGKPEVARLATIQLTAQYPGLKIVGHYSPPFAPLLEMNHREIRRRIQAAKPDLLFVSFGCPKAEKWMAMNYRSLGVPVMIGVGATIDFLAGQVKRAPLWMRQCGLEWLFRLAQEPRRLASRYGNDLRYFGWALVRQWWALRSRRGKQPATGQTRVVAVERDRQWIQPPPRLDAAMLQRDAAVWRTPSLQHCLLDLATVEQIDSSGIGLLLELRKRLQSAGKQLVLLAPSAAVERALKAARLELYFLTAMDPVDACWRIVAREEEQSEGKILPLSIQPMEPWLWRGEITAANAAKVWHHLRRQLRVLCAPSQTLVVDLTNVRFIDSTGARVLMKAKAFAARSKSDLRFIHWSPAVANTLHHAQQDELLHYTSASL